MRCAGHARGRADRVGAVDSAAGRSWRDVSWRVFTPGPASRRRTGCAVDRHRYAEWIPERHSDDRRSDRADARASVVLNERSVGTLVVLAQHGTLGAVMPTPV